MRVPTSLMGVVGVAAGGLFGVVALHGAAVMPVADHKPVTVPALPRPTHNVLEPCRPGYHLDHAACVMVKHKVVVVAVAPAAPAVTGTRHAASRPAPAQHHVSRPAASHGSGSQAGGEDPGDDHGDDHGDEQDPPEPQEPGDD